MTTPSHREPAEPPAALRPGPEPVLFTADVEGRISFLNEPGGVLLGVASGPNVGVRWADHVHPDDWPAWQGEWRRVKGTLYSFAVAVRLRQARDGAWVPTVVRVVPIQDLDGTVHLWYGSAVPGEGGPERDGWVVTSGDPVRRAAEQMEQERRMLARELHDDFAQGLTGVKLTLAALQRSLQGKPEAGLVKACVDEVDGMFLRVRQLLRDLRPPLIDELGLVEAMRALAERQSRVARIPVRVATDGSFSRLSLAVESTAYRLVQESLTNVLRHAQATDVEIRLSEGPTELLVQVADNGCGFDPAAPRHEAGEDGGHGITGMRERVWMLGGTLEIRSSPGRGTTVAASLPIPPASPAAVGGRTNAGAHAPGSSRSDQAGDAPGADERDR